MKTAVFIAPGQIEVQETAKPEIDGENQAIIRVVRASVCGSDLWWYRGIAKREANTLVGHEAIGVVEQVSADVSQIKASDFVIVPFTHGCGHCVACLNGFHAAKNAEVKPGDTVAVIGDGAVGLCGVIGAKLLGAEKIILLSHHEDRAALGREFGATDIVAQKGAAAVQQVLALTKENAGVDAVLECVGAAGAIDQAGQIARPGAVIGRVGVPHAEPKSNQLFWKNIGLRGGIASVTKPDKELLPKAVLDGEINPGKVFTKSFDLDHAADAYAVMDQRQAIKSLLVID